MGHKVHLPGPCWTHGGPVARGGPLVGSNQKSDSLCNVSYPFRPPSSVSSRYAFLPTSKARTRCTKSRVAVACRCFAGFHAIKRACPSLRVCTATLNLDQRFAAHKIFADSFWTEAIDNGFSCKHFHPDFDSSSALLWKPCEPMPRGRMLRTEHTNVFVPGRTPQSPRLGTEITFVAGEDFQWLRVGLATGN